MNNNISITESSVQSYSEISSKKQTFFTYLYFIVSLTNSIIGCYLIFDSEYKHNIKGWLRVLIIVFTFIWLSAIIVGSTSYLLLHLLSKIMNVIRRKENNTSASILNGIYVSCIINLIILYVLAVPVGIVCLLEMIHDTKLSDLQRFYPLYVFISINILIGTIMIFSFLFIVLCIKNKNKNVNGESLNDEFIKKIENEIKETSKVSGVYQMKDISTNPNTTNRNDIINI